MEMYKDINSKLGTNYKNDIQINWSFIEENYELDNEFVEKYYNYLNLLNIIIKRNISINNLEKIFEKHPDILLNNRIICLLLQYYILSDNFILKYKDYLLNCELNVHYLLSYQDINNIIDKLKPDLKGLSIKEINFSLKSNLYYKYPPEKYKWFIGYTGSKLEDIKYCDFYITDSIKIAYFIFNKNIVKVRVWWKDLKYPSVFSKVDIIRKLIFIDRNSIFKR